MVLTAPLTTIAVGSSESPARVYLAETLDGLYTPYALRTPVGKGPFPLILLAYGNGGGGLEWLETRLGTHGYIMDRLLEAGYACAWMRYRTEVELGFHDGGRLVVDRRQGMDLLNRSPLEFEDELAIVRHVAQLDDIDAERLGHVGVSHAGEMLFKLESHFPGTFRVGVACEPANHEFLHLTTDETVVINGETQLRNIERMVMRDPQRVRELIDEPLARERLAPVTLPVLVMGRDDDELQGIFRVTYDVMAEMGLAATWTTYDHPLHGYIFPVADESGVPMVDPVQERAISQVIEFLDAHLMSDRQVNPTPY